MQSSRLYRVATEVEHQRDQIPENVIKYRTNVLHEDSKPHFALARRISGCPESGMVLSGGTVRNYLLGNFYPSDFDFVGDFDIKTIAQRYSENVVGYWPEVGTVKLKIGAYDYDFISTTNIPSTVMEHDITVSNLCLSHDGAIVDYVGGMKSLLRRELKINCADEKIKADPSRIIRVFRFAEQLGFTIEDKTYDACLKNAHLLQFCEHQYELDDVMKLPKLQRQLVLTQLVKIGALTEDEFRSSESLQPNVKKVERKFAEMKVIGSVNALLPDINVLLVGGAVRDTVLDKPVKDFDFKVNTSISVVISILEEKGYIRTDNIHIKDFEYYYNERFGAVSIVVHGVDVDITSMNNQSVSEVLSHGDVNFSCCVYDTKSGRIITPEYVTLLLAKRLYFMDVDRADKDPLIVINALKQISRLPDIVIPEETERVILRNAGKVMEIVRNHPELHYKLYSVFGNINSESVYDFFSLDDQYLLRSVFMQRRDQLTVTDSEFESIKVSDLSTNDRNSIVQLIVRKYGASCDPEKVFASNINSVVIKRQGGTISTCICLDSERIYAIAADFSQDLVKMIKHLCANNYNIWVTADATNAKIISLLMLAGLRIEIDPKVVYKILSSKYAKYKQGLSLYFRGSYPVFDKRFNNDYAQVLLRS